MQCTVLCAGGEKKNQAIPAKQFKFLNFKNVVVETGTYYTYIIATQSALYTWYNRNVNAAYGSLEKTEFHLTDMRGGLLGPVGT